MCWNLIETESFVDVIFCLYYYCKMRGQHGLVANTPSLLLITQLGAEKALFYVPRNHSYFTLTLSAFIRAWTFFFFSCLLWFGLVYLRSRVALGLIYCLPNTLADRVNGRPNPYRVVLSNWIFSNYFGSKLWFILQGLLKELQIKRSINNPWTLEVQSVMGL